MKFLDKLFRRRSHLDPETQRIAVHGLVSGESARSVSDQELIRERGINYDMLHDKFPEVFMEASSVIQRVNPKKPNDPIIDDVDLTAVALRIATSPLFRTTYMDPIEAEINKLKVRSIILSAQLDMNEESYELGGTNYLTALDLLATSAMEDAKRGRKAKLLKVQAKSFEVTTPEQRGKQE